MGHSLPCLFKNAEGRKGILVLQSLDSSTSRLPKSYLRSFQTVGQSIFPVFGLIKNVVDLLYLKLDLLAIS